MPTLRIEFRETVTCVCVIKCFVPTETSFQFNKRICIFRSQISRQLFQRSDFGWIVEHVERTRGGSAILEEPKVASTFRAVLFLASGGGFSFED